MIEEGSEDELKAFEEGYQAPRAVSYGKKKVRIVGTELEFDSYAACGRYLRISPDTVRRIVAASDGVGWRSDVRIELI